MSYLEDFEKTLAEKCHQNEPPFCQAACPFRLDIKGLEEKWKKGRFNAAYRTYQNTVGFPDIVSKLCSHPCEKACLRAKLDGGIAIGLLERATVEYAKPAVEREKDRDRRRRSFGAWLCTASLQ